MSGREWGPSALVLHRLRDQSRKQRHSLTPEELLHLLWAEASGESQPNKLSLSRRRTGSHGSRSLPLSRRAGALSRAQGGGIANSWEQAGGRWAGPLLRCGLAVAPPTSGVRLFRAKAPGLGLRWGSSRRRRRRSTVKAAETMASSGVRGPTPRWGPTLCGAALFLLLLPAAAAQGEGGRGA